MINVILADHQRIYRIGMASALAAEDDIRIIGQPQSMDQLLGGLEKFKAHVLVLSFAFMNKIAEITELSRRSQTAILLLEDQREYLPQFLPEVNGVMQRSADESTVVRCIRHLARGGKVLRFVRDHAIESRHDHDMVGVRVRRRLSQLELRIIALVVQGFKNREIASHLGSTEQGIKNSMRRIFDKTGVSDRLELALFVVHHGTILSAENAIHAVPRVNSIATIQPFRDLSLRRTIQ
jgi:DNA-binding NarL/FixJ family response regulator